MGLLERAAAIRAKATNAQINGGSVDETTREASIAKTPTATQDKQAMVTETSSRPQVQTQPQPEPKTGLSLRERLAAKKNVQAGTQPDSVEKTIQQDEVIETVKPTVTLSSQTNSRGHPTPVSQHAQPTAEEIAAWNKARQEERERLAKIPPVVKVNGVVQGEGNKYQPQPITRPVQTEQTEKQETSFQRRERIQLQTMVEELQQQVATLTEQAELNKGNLKFMLEELEALKKDEPL